MKKKLTVPTPKPRDGRPLSVYMCSDYMGAGGLNQEEEYAETEKHIGYIFDRHELGFKRNVFPHDLRNQRCDIYLFDWGGVMPGSEDMVASHIHELQRQAEDHPSTAFVLYSRATFQKYIRYVQNESPWNAKEIHQPNVFFAGSDWEDDDDLGEGWQNEVRTFLGIKPESE